MRISDWSSDVCSSDLRAMVELTQSPAVVATTVAAADPATSGAALRAAERSRRKWLSGQAGHARAALATAVGAGFLAGLLAAAQAFLLARLIASAITGDRKSTRLNSSH